MKMQKLTWICWLAIGCSASGKGGVNDAGPLGNPYDAAAVRDAAPIVAQNSLTANATLKATVKVLSQLFLSTSVDGHRAKVAGRG